MEDDTWSFAFSASSMSYQSTLKSPSDLCIDFEEIEEDDELKTEYLCPNHRIKLHKGDSYSTLSSLRKELHDSQYQSFLSKSWSSLSSSNSTALHLLLSFLSYPPLADSSESVKSATSSEATLEDNGSNENMLEKDFQPSPLSDKEHLEKSKRCEFMQGLLLSTITDDGL
ncbi:hypothetical protein GQ457_01G054060 [Hibiscus cannabinus]